MDESSWENEEKEPSTCNDITNAPERLMSKCFYSYGKFVARNPWPVLVISGLFLLACCGGFARIGFDFVEENTVDAFLGRGTYFHDKYKMYKRDFPEEEGKFSALQFINIPNFMILYVRGKAPSYNILTPESLLELRQFCSRFASIEVEIDGMSYTYLDLCENFDGVCASPTFCDVVLANQPFPESLSEPLAFYNQTVAYNPIVDMSFIVSAQEAHLDWFLLNNKKAAKWSVEAYKELDELRKNFQETDCYLYSFSQAEYEDQQILEDNIVWLAAGFGLLIFYMVFATFNLRCSPSDGNRILLSISAFLSACLSLGAGFGIMIGAGVPFNPISLIIPFVVIEWAQLGGCGHEERMGRTVASSLVGISLSHLTSFLAFLIGLLSPFPAVDNICLYMAACILFAWIGEGTFFLAILSIHSSLVHASRDQKENQNTQENNKNDEIDLNEASVVEILRARPDVSLVEGVLMWALPRLILWPPMKVKLALGLGVGLAFALVSLMDMPRVEDYSIYYKDGSSIGEFYDERNQHWKFGSALPVMFEEPLDYWDPQVYSRIREFEAEVAQSEYLVPFQSWWLNVFLAFEEANPVLEGSSLGNKELFMSRLQIWRDSVIPGTPLAFLGADVVIEDGEVIRSRMYVNTLHLDSNRGSVEEKFIKEIKDLMKDFKDLHMYTYAFTLSELERNIIMKGQVWVSIAIVAGVAVLVTFFFIPDLKVYLLVLLCFLFAMVSAMGLMHQWGLTYALATYIQIMLGFGLCIDYMAHIARGYMVANVEGAGAKSWRALGVTGVAMTNAASTSILGISMLSATNVKSTRSFFKAMFLIYACAYVFGVMLLPVLLTIWSKGKKEKKPERDSNLKYEIKDNNFQNGKLEMRESVQNGNSSEEAHFYPVLGDGIQNVTVTKIDKF